MALAITGCGGGSGDDSTAAGPAKATESGALSKEELIRQGNAVCTKANIAVSSSGSAGSASEEVVELARIYLGMAEGLKALGPPPSDKNSGYPEFISSVEALARGEKNLKLAYERGNNKRVTAAIAEVSAAVTKFRSSTSDFGFIRCTVPPAPSR